MAAVLAGLTLVIPSPSDPASAATNLFISAEVFASATNCTGQGAVAEPLRIAVDAQDDAWQTGAAAVGASEVHMVDVPTPASGSYVDAHPTPMTFGASGVSMEVSHRQITAAQSLSNANRSDAANSDGDVEPAGYRDPYTPAWGSTTSSRTLQDCAPRPQSLYDGVAQPQPRFWNALYGASTDLNAVVIEFPQPVRAFGAWFGDLETRTDGEGATGRVKLFDAAGDVISNEPIPTSTTDQANGCGGSDTGTDQLGCGNQATRWIGFTETEPTVAAMLVVVGDDDSCNPGLPHAVSLGDCDGNTERLSWIGATVGVAPAALTVAKNGPTDPQYPGASVEFTIQVTNPSDVALDSATVADPLPAGLALNDHDAPGWTCSTTAVSVDCSLDGSLAAASDAPIITLDATIDTNAAPGSYRNEATASWTAGRSSGSETDDHTIEVVPIPTTTVPSTTTTTTTAPPTTAHPSTTVPPTTTAPTTVAPTTAPRTTAVPTTLPLATAPSSATRGSQTLPNQLAATGSDGLDLVPIVILLVILGGVLSLVSAALRWMERQAAPARVESSTPRRSRPS